MSSGSLLTQFLDLDKAITEANISGRKFVYAAQRNRKFLMPRFASGELGDPKSINLGKEIDFNTILSNRSTFTGYKFGATANTPVNTSHMTKGRALWTASRANKVYEDAEILFAEGVSSNDGDVIAQSWARVRDLKNAPHFEDLANGWEAQLWRKPNKFTMEFADITAGVIPEPQCLMSMVNEEANGLWGQGLTVGTYTKKQNIDPTLAEYGNNYKPQRRPYSNFTVNSATNVLAAFDNMSMDVTWETPTKFGEYFQNQEMNKRMIITSRYGRREIFALYRASQNVFAMQSQDPGIPDPQFLGIPISWNDTFGDGAYYPLSTTATGTELTATIGGPRYLWLEGNDIKPCMHPSRFFEQDVPARDATLRPDVWVVWTSLWNQIMYPDLRKHGIVYPDTDLVA